ncbi:MAG: cyclopropane-fatty-acyl-phospholipid synthase [Pseudonocardiales bacterium]|nr:cyclopropane-fatty-acyl-phospholipid synthase [Pseudonocardiales bacterium]
MPQPVAPQLAGLVERLIGAPLPIRLRAWDGSEAGAPDGPVAIVRHRRALRRLLWNPGELGLARAFVAGELDVEGDVAEGLSRFWKLARAQNLGSLRLTTADKLDAAKLAARLGILGPRPKPPASEARLDGRLHTRRRDRAAIAHHYDLSNDFYQFLLDPQMAYSCGYWTQEASAAYGLEDAQRDKLDLICRKLGLKPGMRLLDVGCGWASLLVHAAQHYGVTAVGVTLSAQQRAFGLARVEAAGLADRVEIRLQDYREIPDQPFDAISSIEMGEHVGQDNYPVYAAQLHRLLLPHGRLLLQQMSRGASPWLDTLQDRREEAIRLVGEEQWRVWLLYLAGAALAFEENRMGVHQMLMVRPDADGRSGLPRGRTSTLGRDPELDHSSVNGHGSARVVLAEPTR